MIPQEKELISLGVNAIILSMFYFRLLILILVSDNLLHCFCKWPSQIRMVGSVKTQH